MPSVEYIQGRSTAYLQVLQQKAAGSLGRPVVFRDILKSGEEGPEMIVIPSGTFLMGSPESEWGHTDNESPLHRVTFSQPFALGRYVVTFEEYDRYWEAIRKKSSWLGRFLTKSEDGKPKDAGWGRGKRPVIYVSWKDAQAYCAWLSNETGKKYRLPSESEWEYGCRVGTGTAFWWGNHLTQKQANYDAHYGYGGVEAQKGELIGKTLPVDEFVPNPWGLYQMNGNVFEWCQDKWHDDYTDAPTDGSAWETGTTELRIVRGGSWYNLPEWVRSGYRSKHDLMTSRTDLSFRLAQSI